jgi:hypothetical protein
MQLGYPNISFYGYSDIPIVSHWIFPFHWGIFHGMYQWSISEIAGYRASKTENTPVEWIAQVTDKPLGL